MRKMAGMALVVGAAVLGSGLTLTAQQAAQGTEGPGGPGFGRGFGPRFGFGPGPFGFGGFGGFGGPAVKNQPYVATESSTDTLTRKDGKPVTHNVTEQRWRDAAGRTRSELTLPAEGKRPAVHRAEIFDPVAHTITSLDFNKKIAFVRQLPERPHRERSEGEQPRQRPERPGVTVKETDLPGKQIAGVYATGKQVTRTVAAGVHGNAEPITQTGEWYVSPDLKIVLYSSESGPRNSSLHQVTQLQRVDPNATLFEVPEGFTVKNAPEHGFRGPRGPRGGQGGSDGAASTSGE